MGFKKRGESRLVSIVENAQTAIDVARLRSTDIRRRVLAPARWVRLPVTTGQDALEATSADFRSNHPSVRTAVRVLLESRGVNAEKLQVKLDPIDGGYFRAVTNLGELGIAPADAHKIVQHALSATSRMNEKLSEMREHHAITGIGELDRRVLDARFDFLLGQLSSQVPLSQARRALELVDLPDLGEAAAAGQISLERVLEIRETDECQQFRAFVWSAESLDNAELRERVRSLRARVADNLGTRSGKILRFVANAALGTLADLAVPGGSTGVGVLDTFVVDHLFPKSGIVTFVGKLYPSIFSKD